jgi:type VI protein secretion system component VasK
VEFEMNLHSVSENVAEVTFDINGASHTYKNEPEEWVPVSWPPKDPKSQQSRVKIHGYSSLDEEILRPGEWGFFRLMDAATRIEEGTEGGRRGAPATIVVTWSLRSQAGVVKMDIRPSKDESVFPSYIKRKMRIFKPYQCPRVISYGVR